MLVNVVSGDQLKKELDDAYRRAQRAGRNISVAEKRLAEARKLGNAGKIMRAEMLLAKWQIDARESLARLQSMQETAKNWFMPQPVPGPESRS